MKNAQLDDVLRLLGRRDVEALFENASKTVITEEALADFHLPAGFTLRQTRELLGAVRRLQAIKAPLPDVEGIVYWYTLAPELARAVRYIERHCSQGSALDVAISQRPDRRVLVRSYIDEAIATSRLDGVALSYDSARELLQMEAAPINDDERIVVNTQRALSQLPMMAEEEWTPDLLVALYEMVTEGTTRSPVVMDAPVSDRPGSMTRRELLEAVCDTSNDRTRFDFEHPAITALLLYADVDYYRPFPAWNGALGRLVLKLHTLRYGYPVLGYLPISSAIAAWEEGAIAPPATVARPGQNNEFERHSEVDITPYLGSHLQLVCRTIEQLTESIEEANRRDEELRSLLQSDPSLNPRQRTILGRALRVAGATFRIRYHQTTHNIVYSTARADFVELVDKGYLQMEQVGKAFVFSAAPDLRARIGHVDDEAAED